MATIAFTKTARRGIHKWEWAGMGNGDDGLPVAGLGKFKTKTVRVEGTVVTSVAIEGRMGSGLWHVLNDTRGEGNPLTFAVADTREVLENVDEIRPTVTTGTAVKVTLQIAA